MAQTGQLNAALKLASNDEAASRPKGDSLKRSEIEQLVAAGMPHDLVSQVPQCQRDTASRVHHHMLGLLHATPGKPGRAERRSSRDVRRRTLVDGLNSLMAPLLRRARRSLEVLSASRCAFACDIEAYGGEVHQWTTTFDGIPVCTDQLAALRMIGELAVLSATQQAVVVKILGLERDLTLARIHLQFAREDKQTDATLLLRREVAGLTSQVNGLRQSLSIAFKPWEIRNRRRMDALPNAARIAPAVLRGRARSSDFLEAASLFQSLGESMYLPIPLDESARPELLSRWRRHWNSYEACGKALLVVATWVRALGSGEPCRRCDLCFRHRGRKMRCHCVVHKRTASKRIPRREELVSREYKAALGRSLPLIPSTPSIEKVMGEAPAPGMVRAARHLELPDELKGPALRLGSLLRWLHPLLNFKQRRRIAMQFGGLLRECMQPFQVDRFPTLEMRVDNDGRRRVAVQRVSWIRFFGEFFGSKAGADIAAGAGRGCAIDFDHPLTSTTAVVSDRELVLDLHRFRAWIDADFAIDGLAYLSDAAVLDEFLRQQGELEREPSLRELAAVLKASPTTIDEALKRAKRGEGDGPLRRKYSKRRGTPS